MGIVLDASVTLWCFPDEQKPLSLQVLDRLNAGEEAREISRLEGQSPILLSHSLGYPDVGTIDNQSTEEAGVKCAEPPPIFVAARQSRARPELLQFHPDRFNLRIEIDRVLAEFTAEAGLLVAAKRRDRI